MNLDVKKNLGWLIIGLIMFSVLKNFAVVIYFAIIKARTSLALIFESDDKMLDSPLSS